MTSRIHSLLRPPSLSRIVTVNRYGGYTLSKVQSRGTPQAAMKTLGLALLLVTVQACATSPQVIQIAVALKNTEIYEYRAVGGDEAGASIATQARHYTVSEIRRDSTTNWAATYVYQPATDFVGSDVVLLEITTNAAGAGPSTVNRVAIHFQVHN